MVVEVELSRLLPPEAKDAYRYIYSAVQMREGFNYHTPALDDLRAQSVREPGDSVDRQNLKWDNYHSLFFTHYPLHSALLLVISVIGGVTLGTAYKIITVLGSLLDRRGDCLSPPYHHRPGQRRSGPGFPGPGHLPHAGHSLCGAHQHQYGRGADFICRGAAQRWPRSKWPIFLLTTMVLFMHRAGIVYAGLGFLAVIFLRYKKEDIREIVVDLTPTLAVICLYVLITYIFPLPMFRLSPMARPPDTSYFKEVLANSGVLLQQFGQWFLMHGVATLPKQLQDLVIYKFSLPTQAMLRNNWLILLTGSQIVGLGLLILPWLVAGNRATNTRGYAGSSASAVRCSCSPYFRWWCCCLSSGRDGCTRPRRKKRLFTWPSFSSWGFCSRRSCTSCTLPSPGIPSSGLTSPPACGCPLRWSWRRFSAGVCGGFRRKSGRDHMTFFPVHGINRVQGLGLLRPRFLWASVGALSGGGLCAPSGGGLPDQG